MNKKTSKYVVALGMGFLLLIQIQVWAGEKIGALGRIKPKGDLLYLFGPSGVKIDKIMVKEGKVVKKDQPLADFKILTTAKIEQALAELSAREADELGLIGITVQKETIKAMRAEYGFSARRVGRFKKLDGQQLSEQQMDHRQSQASITYAKLEAAKRKLEQLELNRDLNKERTLQRVELSKEKVRQATLRAPRDGTILEILQGEGETMGKGPVIIMADLANMYVIAEIFEGDLLNLRTGMKATITNNTFLEPLEGEIESIGRIIDPASRTAKVKIRLRDTEPASKLINMEVDVSVTY